MLGRELQKRKEVYQSHTRALQISNSAVNMDAESLWSICILLSLLKNSRAVLASSAGMNAAVNSHGGYLKCWYCMARVGY
jgi:hypothetical protein